MHLGDFGAAIKELDPNAEKDSFGFFGEKFEIVDELPPMLIFQLAASMTGKVDETEGMGAMWAALNVSLGQDGFSRFYKLAIAKRANINSLMEVVMELFQNSGGERPTVPVSDLPSGPLSTSPSSNTSSSTPPASGADDLIMAERGREDLERDLSVPHLVPISQVLAG